MEKLTNVGCVKNVKQADGSNKMIWSLQQLTLSFNLDAFTKEQVNKWALGACWIYIQGLLRSRFDTAQEARDFLMRHNMTITPELVQELLDMASRTPRRDPGVSLVEKIRKMPEGPERNALKAEYIKMLQEI